MQFTSEERVEICKSYLNAERRGRQIQILADLYGCEPTEIEQVLIVGGAANSAEIRQIHTAGRGTGAGKAARRMSGAITALKDEKKYLDRRAQEIPRLIAELEAEFGALESRRAAVDACLQRLEEAF